jgi:hypothetical protein
MRSTSAKTILRTEESNIVSSRTIIKTAVDAPNATTRRSLGKFGYHIPGIAHAKGLQLSLRADLALVHNRNRTVCTKVRLEFQACFPNL